MVSVGYFLWHDEFDDGGDSLALLMLCGLIFIVFEIIRLCLLLCPATPKSSDRQYSGLASSRAVLKFVLYSSCETECRDSGVASALFSLFRLDENA